MADTNDWVKELLAKDRATKSGVEMVIMEYGKLDSMIPLHQAITAKMQEMLATQRAKDKAAVLTGLPEKYNAASNVVNKMWHDGYDLAIERAKQAIEQVYKDEY